jgi:hypothetical protein
MLELQDGTRMNSQARVQNDINLHNQRKRAVKQVECKWCDGLIGTTSSKSFTWPATFGRKHHSPPYIIFYAYPHGLHLNNIFSQDSQVEVPKLVLVIPKLWKFISSLN